MAIRLIYTISMKHLILSPCFFTTSLRPSPESLRNGIASFRALFWDIKQHSTVRSARLPISPQWESSRESESELHYPEDLREELPDMNPLPWKTSFVPAARSSFESVACRDVSVQIVRISYNFVVFDWKWFDIVLVLYL